MLQLRPLQQQQQPRLLKPLLLPILLLEQSQVDKVRQNSFIMP
jgi:hypothetical protein